MAEAEVGDDQYGEDPTVRRLEERSAELLGKEAACYVSSGTMGNLIAILTHCGRGDEVLLGNECHVLWYESGGAAALGGLPFSQLTTDRMGAFDPQQVRDLVRIRRPRLPAHRRPLPGEYPEPLRRHGLAARVSRRDRRDRPRAGRAGPPRRRTHLQRGGDARTARQRGRRVGRFDPVLLLEGLAAPVGSIVVGSKDFIAGVRANRKIVGGAMRQAGVIAAAALGGLDEMIDRLPEDHRRATPRGQKG